MNSAMIRKQKREARLNFIVSVIGYSTIAAINYLLFTGVYFMINNPLSTLFNQGVNAMIYKTIDIYDFRAAFTDYDRNNEFSYEGLGALFDWLSEMANDCTEPYELDVIALCCEFTEYSDLAEIKDIYSNTEINSIDDLYDHTIVIEFDGGIIIQDF